MPSAVPERILFVPASGPRGSGEVYRGLDLARALIARRPGLDLHVVLDRAAAVEPDAPWTVHPLDATPARAGAATLEVLERLSPALAVFDGSGRTAHLRAVRARGGRVVWAANRPGRRRRGFSPRRLPWIDLLLLIGPGRGAASPGPIERGLLRAFGRPGVLQVGAVAPEPAALPDGQAPDPARPPVVFVSGGGGQYVDGSPVPDVFLAAARDFHAGTGWPTWVLLGPRYAGSEAERFEGSDFRVLRSLPTDQLSGLLGQARLVVTGAGNMLSNQVLLARRPSVMVAVGGHDQPARLGRYVEAGAVRPAALSAEALSRAARDLFDDKAAAESLVVGIDRLGVVNDTGRVADRLLALLDEPAVQPA